MNTRTFLFLLLIVAATAVTWSQDGNWFSGTVRVLTLDECRRLGRDASVSLRAADASAAEARGHLAETRFQVLPSAVLSASYNRLSDIEAGTITAVMPSAGTPLSLSLDDPILDATVLKLAVSQPLFTGLRIRNSVEQASALVGVAQGSRERTAQTVAEAVEAAYWDAVGAKEAAAICAEYVKQARRHLEDTGNYLNQGLVIKNDLLKAEMRLSAANTQKIDADTAFTAARVRLNLLIGLEWNANTDTEALPAYAGETGPEERNLDRLIAAGRAWRVEPAIAEERVRADQAALRMARSPLYPGAYLTGDLTLANPNQRYFPPRDQVETTWSLGVLVSLDAGRIPAALAQTEQAAARMARDVQALAGAKETVIREIVSAFLRTEQTRQRVLNAETYLAQAEENLRGVREQFQRGVVLDTDVADAEGLLLAARLQWVDARVSTLKAEAALTLAVGKE